ncbi:glycosyltransferase family protein [Hufsiella ginkgonis]|uniref:Glycosyl transferase n=1 Tax=Hufsiella ginkgonis TaxID=2695274 RepID=A0A7K1XXG5_9SPHI|nr:glycosyltransferase family protein [Hufsiella ginkgonis]MXV15705.1 glycosyl transferase [Hufsiella ginkgonis]
MRILYAIQGTGNGHLGRSMDVVPCLRQHGQVDVLVSGIQGDLVLPFPVKYKLRGLSFIFGKKGGVDLWKTIAKASFRKFIKGVNTLPVADYDLVINDFEPVSAWACYAKNKPCIALSHQAAVLAPESPRAEHTDMIGKMILNNYAPSSSQYGFHFAAYNESIFTPVIRSQVRTQELKNKGHISVYLPAYDDDQLVKRLSEFPDVEWDVFSKHNRKTSRIRNVSLQPVNNAKFIESMAASAGVLCGAGFETPAEALFMGKKLMVVPMKGQYEQHLNAAALKTMGVPVINNLKPRHEEVISAWLGNDTIIPVNYPDMTSGIVEKIVARHTADPFAEWDSYNYLKQS